MQMADTPIAGPVPRLETPHEARVSWSSLRLLPARLWVALGAVLLITVTVAALAQFSTDRSWTRAGLLVVSLLSLVLLLGLMRLLVTEALRREQRQVIAAEAARELEMQIEARTRELSALSTHLQEFAEKEKSELARNLHDELGGLLTAAKMDLSWLQSRVAAPALQERLAQLGGVLDEAMDLKRRVVEDLRPSLLDHFGLPTALRAYVDSACAKAGLTCELTIPEDAQPIPKDVAIALFRIAQEGVTNILRHAQAKCVRLQLTTTGTAYAFTLADDGTGFDSADPQLRLSHGFMGMRQRVRALGGRLTIESTPGRGTTLRVEVPKPPA
jgi:signal transduction histidine kinase